jgi:hypothetical protein
VTTPFTGWLLDEDERAALLVRLPARHGEAIAHHVTLSVRDATRRRRRLTTAASATIAGEIVGQADDDVIGKGPGHGGTASASCETERPHRLVVVFDLEAAAPHLSHHLGLVARRRPQPARKQRRDRRPESGRLLEMRQFCFGNSKASLSVGELRAHPGNFPPTLSDYPIELIHSPL